MDVSILITIAVGLVVIGVVVYQVRQGKVVVDSPRSALRAFYEARELVETYVPAADQLFAIGALPKQERLPYVIRMVMDIVTELDEAQVRGIIEGYIAKQKREAAE